MIYISGDDACAYKNVRSEHYTWATKDNIEVQAVDTNGGVVLDTKINVFLNTKTKVSGVTEVVFPQLVFPNFQPSFKDFFSFGSTDRAVDSDLFVSPDTEGSDSVTGLREDRGLSGKLLEHFGGTGETIATLSNADVQTQLADLQVPHGVLQLCLGNHGCGINEDAGF